MSVKRRTAQPASTWPADWPPIEIWTNERGARATPTGHQRTAIDTAIAAELRRLDVHPWEMLAATRFNLFGLDGFPPVATAWGTIANACHPEIITQARSAARVAEIAATRIAGSIDRHCLEVTIGGPLATTIDLPPERLWRLDRQQVIDQLVQAMADGQAWAAATLAQAGHEP